MNLDAMRNFYINNYEVFGFNVNTKGPIRMQAQKMAGTTGGVGAGHKRWNAGLNVGLAFGLGWVLGWGAGGLGSRSVSHVASDGSHSRRPQDVEREDARNLPRHRIAPVRIGEAAPEETDRLTQAGTIEVLEFDRETGDVVGKINVKVPGMFSGD